MNRSLRPALLLFTLGALSLTGLAQDSSDPLAAGFASPPASAKPRTWWHWVSGNVSREGITADLEAMKQIGLAGAQIFTVDQSDVKGPIKFMSPEWKGLVQHALSEAHRLDLEISMEGCDGWSESGGPWVTPAEGMQQVVWSERQVAGGAKVPLDLPRPVPSATYYEDIALYAYPMLEGSESPAKITSSDPAFQQGDLTQGAQMSFVLPDQPQWLEMEYTQPVTLGSVRFDIKKEPRPGSVWQVQVSDDGTQFRDIGTAKPGGSVFPPAKSRFFRLWRSKVGPQTAALKLTGARFSGAQLPLQEARAGIKVSLAANDFTTAEFPPAQTIDPKTLVNLTGQKEWDAPAGQWTLLRLGHSAIGTVTHPSTHPGLECDKLSPVAVTHHMDNLFGPVFAGSPDLVGNTFKFILLDSWEAGCENWTPQMAAEFQKRRGYDLTPWLPALSHKVIASAELTQRFLWDYRRTLADLVAEEHYGTIQKIAHDHHMQLMSEASGNGIPTVADQLLCKKYTDVPMGEFWVNNTGDANVNDTKEAACAAHIYGQNIASAESFTSIPKTAAWKNDPYSLKAMGDQEFCLGINRFIFHRYAHQPWLDRKPGMSMGPWGINFERTNTWWEPGSAWISYLSRCQYLLQQGHFEADLCYFYGEGAPATVRRASLQPMPPAGFDWDVCNADAILNLMQVKDGRIAVPSGVSYRVLVLPNDTRMTLPVLQKIQSLVRDGATVYGPKPTLSPSLTGYPANKGEVAKLADELWGSCDGVSVLEHPYGKGRIVLGTPLEKLLEPLPDFASSQPDVLFIHRQAAPADIYFVSNQQNGAITADCTFRVTGKFPSYGTLPPASAKPSLSIKKRTAAPPWHCTSTPSARNS